NEVIYVKKFVEVGHNNTLCLDHTYEGIICHQNCGVEYNKQDANDLRKCDCLSENKLCMKCECGPESNIAEELLINKIHYEKAVRDYQDSISNADACKNILNELNSKVEGLCE
ncbi:9219_t:CDS:2, partial [Dentiscutata erythropus]